MQNEQYNHCIVQSYCSSGRRDVRKHQKPQKACAKEQQDGDFKELKQNTKTTAFLAQKMHQTHFKASIITKKYTMSDTIERCTRTQSETRPRVAQMTTTTVKQEAPIYRT